jgi:hypothetical protein
MDYPFELKKYLSTKMAKVDAECMGVDFQQAYEYHLANDPFTLLEYWAEYFGAFDTEENLFIELSPNSITTKNQQYDSPKNHHPKG